jgi:FtsH-binding integral membrane protein
MEGWSPQYQYTAALIVGVFTIGLIFFAAASVIAWRSKEGLSDRYMKLTVIILVVVVAVTVSIAGFQQEQTNSALGLIGTIVGYLLGRSDRATS